MTGVVRISNISIDIGYLLVSLDGNDTELRKGDYIDIRIDTGEIRFPIFDHRLDTRDSVVSVYKDSYDIRQRNLRMYEEALIKKINKAGGIAETDVIREISLESGMDETDLRAAVWELIERGDLELIGDCTLKYVNYGYTS